MVTQLVNTALPIDHEFMNEGMGAFIERRMAELGITTQAELARRAGVQRAHLSQVLSGKIALPSPEMRRKLARALGVRHLDLLVAAGELTPDEAGYGVGPPAPALDPDLVELLRELPPNRIDYIKDSAKMAIQAAALEARQSAGVDT